MKNNFHKTLIILFFIFWLSFHSLGFSTETINKIVAVVGDEFLTLYELDEMCTPFFEKFITQDLPPEAKEKVKKQIREKILKSWIEGTLLKIEAKKYGITVSDEELERFLSAEIRIKGGEEKLKEYLKTQGISYEEYKENLKEELLKIKLVQLQVREKVVITQDELKKAYEEAIKNYDIAPKYWLSILIIKEDENLANFIYEEILKGKNFEELYKSDPSKIKFIKEESFKKQEIASDILQNIEKISPGEVAPIIKRNNEFYIIRLLKTEAGNPPSFEEMQERLYQNLFQLKSEAILEKWIKELEEKRYIKIYL